MAKTSPVPPLGRTGAEVGRGDRFSVRWNLLDVSGALPLPSPDPATDLLAWGGPFAGLVNALPVTGSVPKLRCVPGTRRAGTAAGGGMAALSASAELIEAFAKPVP